MIASLKFLMVLISRRKAPLATITLAVLVSCDSSNPVGYGGNLEFVLYAANSAKPEIYSVDLETHSVIDTFSTSGFGVGKIAVTEDGRKLLATADRVYLIDLESGTNSVITPYGYPSVAPDNTVFLQAEDGLYLVNPMTGSSSFFDSVDVGREIVFGRGSSRMFGVEDPVLGDSLSRIVTYDFQTKEVRKSNPLRLRDGSSILLFNVLPSVDLEHVFFTSRSLDAFWFGVYRVSEDSIIHYHQINSPGQLALSRDGHRVYLSDPGVHLRPIPVPSGSIGVIRTHDFQFEETIRIGFVDSFGSDLIPTDQIVLSEDGRLAYVTTWSYIILCVDLVQKTVTNTIEFSSRNTLIHEISVKRKL